jgi:divalent metal cation (Fe/Co/Zn/Cd) transporter
MAPALRRQPNSGDLKDTIMIKDRPYDRAVQVTVIAPDDMNVTNVQELAEKAWRSVNKEITVGGVTVKVRGFGR